mgnify:CR=1 FL=1
MSNVYKKLFYFIQSINSTLTRDDVAQVPVQILISRAGVGWGGEGRDIDGSPGVRLSGYVGVGETMLVFWSIKTDLHKY